MSYYENLTKQYPVTKTIRNELIPIGKTLENIKRDNILEIDYKRKEYYERVKELMDGYHKILIEESLTDVKLEWLNRAAEAYFSNNDNSSAEFEESQDYLRKEIATFLSGHKNFKLLGTKEILKVLEEVYVSEDDFNAIESFKKFYTYFNGYNKTRANLYSADKKSTAVANRMINENLPKFLDNIKVYQFVKNARVIAEGLTEEDQDVLFWVDTFNTVLTQIGIEKYNIAIGRINQAINLYNQNRSNEAGHKIIPKLKPLYKQLLSDKTDSFIDKFSSDEELVEAIKKYVLSLKDAISTEKIYTFFEVLLASGGEGIFIKNQAPKTTFSQLAFGDWREIDNLLCAEYDIQNLKKKKTEKYYDKRDKDLKKNKSYELSHIIELSEEDAGNIIGKYIKKIKQDIDVIFECNSSFQFQWDNHDKNKKLSKHTDAVAAVKALLDAIKDLEHDVMLINGSGQEVNKNLVVYGEHEPILKKLKEIDPLYNMTRNYLTQKPFSTEKIKLNFNSPTLLDGWTDETSNLGAILLKDGKYYLGILSTIARNSLKNAPPAKSESTYKKVDYRLLSGPNKMLPKVFFAKSKIDYYTPSEELLEKYKAGTHTKGDNFSLEDCHNLIDFFKDSIEKHPEWKKFGFKFSETNTYADISGFYKEIEKQGYKISFRDVDVSYIDSLVDAGDLYLFQIYNMDFSEYSKGNLDLHTLYLSMLFDERNLNDIVYKLNGEAEIFYRPASILQEDMIIHEANKAINNKNPLIAKNKPSSTFEYDIIKDRRYTQDKFILNLPITMNFGVTSTGKINNVVNNAIRSDESVRVIGINRGERNLLYIVVLDSDGTILEQISLNSIINKTSKHTIQTDYHRLLSEREESRDMARKEWRTIDNIKDLKEGYLSQVVNVIVKLVVKYNAVICLEDLSPKFKQGRQKIEKQVYQKFEKMLINKLNYIVTDKSRRQSAPNNLAGALNALQLTNDISSSHKDFKIQNGIIFYVSPYMTTNIDPTTGFTSLFFTRYENMEKAKEFFSRFSKISYNDAGYFEFTADYKKFTEKAFGLQNEWTICTKGERIAKFRNPEKQNKWDENIVNLTAEMKSLFDTEGINYNSGEDIKEAIIKVNNAGFCKKLIWLFTLTLQMRNSTFDGKQDYIISPVVNENGNFFKTDKDIKTAPENIAANGAYNIAKKGLWMIKKIRETAPDDMPKLGISNQEWLEYAQQNVL